MAGPQNFEFLLERNKEAMKTHVPAPLLSEMEYTPSLCIVTCADPRCVPEQFFKLKIPETVIMRTAGGAVAPVLYGIATLDALIGFKEVWIIHHTDCGGFVTDPLGVRQVLTERSPESKAQIDAAYIPHYEDLDQSVRDDVKLFRDSKIIRPELRTQTRGFAYDIKTGEVKPVV